MEQKGDERRIRSFIAVDISGEVRKNLEELISELKPKVAGVKWVRPEGIHLTLKFLGGVAPELIPSIREVMEQVAGAAAPFTIEVKGLGAFPGPGRPRVIWVGVEEPTGALKELAGRVEAGMQRLGFEPEARAFHPHLTLARVRKDGRPGKELEGLIERSRHRPMGSFEVSEMVLFRSDLKPDGAVYTRLECVELAGRRSK